MSVENYTLLRRVTHVCLRPIKINVNGKLMFLPCRKCAACLNNRSSRLSRLMQLEAQQREVTLFVTLTYAPEYLPMMYISSAEPVTTCARNVRLNYEYRDSKTDEIVTYSIYDKISLLQDKCELDGGLIPYLSKTDLQKFFKIPTHILPAVSMDQNISAHIITYYSTHQGKTYNRSLMLSITLGNLVELTTPLTEANVLTTFRLIQQVLLTFPAYIKIKRYVPSLLIPFIMDFLIIFLKSLQSLTILKPLSLYLSNHLIQPWKYVRGHRFQLPSFQKYPTIKSYLDALHTSYVHSILYIHLNPTL